MAWIERDLKDHLVSTPCRGQRCHPPAQAAQGSFNLALNAFSDGAPQLPWATVPAPQQAHRKEFHPNASSKPTLFLPQNYYPLFLTEHSLTKRPSLSFLLVLEGCNKVCLEMRLLFIGEVLQASDHLHGLLQTQTSRSKFFLIKSVSQDCCKSSTYGLHTNCQPNTSSCWQGLPFSAASGSSTAW